jgi:hypothetical protein
MAHQLFQLPKATPLNTGTIMPGAKVSFFLTGTSTPTPVYTDSGLSIAHTQPVVANAAGTLAPIYLDPAIVYKATITSSADVLLYTVDPVNDQLLSQAIIGGYLYPQTDAEEAAGVTPVNYAYAPGDVRRYGADNDANSSLFDSADAVRNALLANERIFFPAGTYIIGSTIELHGERIIVMGEYGGTRSALSTKIIYTGSGELFNATGTEFGGIYIGHLWISGGSGDGAYCITSTRPQSVFERINMETYDNPGIQLQSATQGSWSSQIRHCKYVAPDSATDYTGFDISINGGEVELYKCAAIRGNIGIDIHQGQAIRIVACDCNLQNGNNSSESASDGQAAIRLTGSWGGGSTLYKPVIEITGCYLEGCTNAVYADSVESLDINNTFINDVGFGLYAIYLKNGDVQNVSITNCQILMQRSDAVGVYNNSDNKVLIENNYFDLTGGGSSYWLSAAKRCDYGYNRVITGTLNDATGLTFDIEPAQGSWTPVIAGSTTAGTQTYSLQFGRYYKHGRLVHADFAIVMSAKDGTTAGNFTITGLPFASMNNSSRVYNVAIGAHGGIDLTAGKTQVGGTVGNSASSITLFESGDNVALAALGASAITSSTAVYGSCSYEI